MPLPANPMMSAAATDLGLGDMLRDQVGEETEETRKKRMLEQQQRSLMGSGGSPAASMLYPNGYGAAALGGGILGKL